MKVLCTGDWHAHNFTDFSKMISVDWDSKTLRYERVYANNSHIPCKDMNSRLFYILKGICDMRDYCLDNGIKHILFSGDLFHKRANIEVTVFNAVHKVLKTFKEKGITVHILAGNHDQVDSSQIPASAIYSLRDIAHVIENPEYFLITEENEELEVVAVPYSKDKNFILNSIKSFREKCTDSKSAVLLTHLGISGGVTGSGMYVMSDEYNLKELSPELWKYIVLGHYHRPQLLCKNTFYCGTPVQNSFNDEIKGDNGYNGFFIIDTSKRYDIEFIPLIAPRFVTVSSVEDLGSFTQEFLENNYVRVKTKAENVEEVKELLEQFGGEETLNEVRLELEKSYVTEARSDINVSMSFEDTIKTYVSEKCSDNDKKLKIENLGLEILSEVVSGGGES